MAKGIKKFDQEIRVINSWISLSSTTHYSSTETGYGAFYSFGDLPYYGNDSTHYILANNNYHFSTIKKSLFFIGNFTQKIYSLQSDLTK